MIYKLITIVLLAFSFNFTPAQELNLFSPNFTLIKSNLETNQIYSQTNDIEKQISIKFDIKNSFIEIDYLDDIPLDYERFEIIKTEYIQNGIMYTLKPSSSIKNHLISVTSKEYTIVAERIDYNDNMSYAKLYNIYTP